jgi:hypothetical protein
MPIQVTEWDPLDACPMSSPIKPRPRKADSEQYTHQPQDKHCSPGSAEHAYFPVVNLASDDSPTTRPHLDYIISARAACLGSIA